MSRKSIGLNAERELLKRFWAEGWPCIRSAGSGSMRFPSPDLLVGSISAGTALAIECKTTRSNAIYLKKKEINELREFSSRFGAMPFIAVNFDKWYFLSLEDLEQHKESYGVKKETAIRKGFLFEEIIRVLTDKNKKTNMESN